MKISKTKDRELHTMDESPTSIILVENIAFQRAGYSRRTWSNDRIRITLDELRKLADAYLK